MGKVLKPDLQEADRFVSLLDPAEIITTQTFDDNSVRKDMRLAHVFHGTLSQHTDALTRLQQQGAGVFVMVNRGDGVIHEGRKTCRTADSVVAVRALFADLDGAPLQPVLEAHYPDIVVESSPGRWHAYWRTDDCPLDQFKLRQQQIATKFGADIKVCDLPRVMRLPGFWHQKGEPFMTRVIHPGVSS